MSTISPADLGLEASDLRCTLELGGLALPVERVRERTSLARPPELVIDADVGAVEAAELQRQPAALLMEHASGSRYVQGWVRGVERYGDVQVGARLRIILVPTTLMADAGAQAGLESAEPEYVYDPAAWAAAAVEAEGEEDTQRFSRAELEAWESGRMAVVPAEVPVEPIAAPTPEPVAAQTMVIDAHEPEAPRITGSGTELMSRADILRMLASGDVGTPTTARSTMLLDPEQARRMHAEREGARASLSKSTMLLSPEDARASLPKSTMLLSPEDARKMQVSVDEGRTEKVSMTPPSEGEGTGTQTARLSAEELAALRGGRRS